MIKGLEFVLIAYSIWLITFVIYIYLNKKRKKYLDETGIIPTDMGIGIKSDMIKEVFKFNKTTPVNNVKFDKSTLYQKMLPSIAIVVVKLNEEWITKKKK